MTPCVAYVRVSREEQEKTGYSFPQQRKKIVQYASCHKHEVVKWFQESHSARHTGRPQFEAMLRYLEEAPSVRTVLVHKQNRSSRNLTDWARLTEVIGVRVIAVDEPVEDTPMGRLTQTFGIGIAKFYSDNLAEEVKKGLRGKFEAGGFVSRAPVGYVNIPRTRTEKSRVDVNPETAPLVRMAFERYATGMSSLQAIAEELYDQGLKTRHGKPFSKERVSRILRSPIYKGLVVYGGETRPGVHEPLIDEDLWIQVQQVLAQRSQTHGDKGSRFFLLRGLLYCTSCNRRMTAEVHARGSYYRCTPNAFGKPCPAPYSPVDALDKAVESLLPNIELTREGRAAVLAALERIEAEHQDRRAREERSLRTRKDELQDKLNRLTEGFANGVVPAEQYKRFQEIYARQVDTIEAELAFLSADLSEDVEAVRQLVTMASGIERLYMLAETPADKKAHLRYIFKRITVRDRQVADIEYNPPFHLLLGDTAPGSKAGLERALLDHLSPDRP